MTKSNDNENTPITFQEKVYDNLPTVTNPKGTKDITDIVPQEEIDEIFTELTNQDPKSKLYKFCLYYLFGFPMEVCSKKAGYSKTYGYKIVEKYKKQSKLRQRVDEILNMFPDRYRAVCKMRLPQIAEIEGKALKEYEDSPKLAIDKPQLLKQVKQAGGVDMSEKDTPPAMTINIKSIEKVQIAMTEMLTKRLEGSKEDTK